MMEGRERERDWFVESSIFAVEPNIGNLSKSLIECCIDSDKHERYDSERAESH